jgi:hypothetical protein
MPLDPTLMDLDNLNPINSTSAASNKYVKAILFSLSAITAIVAIGFYFYEKKHVNVKSK